MRNAEYFEKLGGALVINESGVNENSLLMTIEMLMIDRNKLAKLGKTGLFRVTSRYFTSNFLNI